MTSPVRFIVAILGCLHLCGGHYGVLQGIAWTQMLVTYSAEDGWIEGARRTFDGEHPCDLCVAIADAKQQDNRHDNPGPRHRGLESGLELKPCPLSSPLVIKSPSDHDPLIAGRSRPPSSTPLLPSAPDSPPPRHA